MGRARFLFSMFIAFFISLVLSAETQPQKQFNITKTWDGQPLLEGEYIQITLSASDKYSGDLKVEVDAPWYDDSEPIKNARCLWKSEVVETYFANDKDFYAEIQMSPNSVYQVLLFDGYRSKAGLTKSYEYTVRASTTQPDRWIGVLHVSSDIMPPNMNKFNAHAMHGLHGEDRQYLSLYPVNETVPRADFHQLAFFRTIDLSEMIKTPKSFTPIWRNAMKNKGKKKSKKYKC